MEMPMADVVFTVAWFDGADWDEVKRLTVGLQDTYADWLAAAEAGTAAVESEMGATVHKVIIPVSKLRDRHALLRRKLDGNDRSQLAIDLTGSEPQGNA
jgi:hypothetical protein